MPFTTCAPKPLERVETFTIHEGPGIFYTIFDTDDFNNWGERNDIACLETARLWCQWAHAFKTGRTFQTFQTWRDNRH